MVKKVIWSKEAALDRKQIIVYWNKRNKSTLYGKKLRLLFDIAIKRIQLIPTIGKNTNYEGVRVKLVRDYFIVYKELFDCIRIIAIWDCRQNPIKFEKIIS